MPNDAVSWDRFAAEAPELATAVRARLEATKHHVLATLRSDSSPRVSGSEVAFFGDDLVVGSMPDAVKARDLQRDGRFAVHANPGDGSMNGGDAKLAGRAVEVTDDETLAAFMDSNHPPEPFHLFRLLISEVVLTTLHPDGDRLVIRSWHPDVGERTVERA